MIGGSVWSRSHTPAMSLLWISCFALWCSLALAELTYYRAYDDVPISKAEALAGTQDHRFWCVDQFESTCDVTEFRRLDGSCNSLKHPLAGAGHYTWDRLLEPNYSFDSAGRVSTGSESARRLRTQALAEGAVPSAEFTQLLISYGVFMIKDIAYMKRPDAMSYIYEHPNCCGSGAADPMCANLIIPADDPVHRFSGLTCMNFTYPISYESKGCILSQGANTVPNRMNFGTPQFDLSQMYGNLEETSRRQRAFTGGLLRTARAEGTSLPYPDLTPGDYETHDGARNISSQLFQPLLFHWRLHNAVASALAAHAPCWDDERLFQSARDINIALYNQILFHELWPALLGYDNMVEAGLISRSPGHRDLYDPLEPPRQFAESIYALRWLHVIAGGYNKLFDVKGNEVGRLEAVVMPLRWDLRAASQSGLVAPLNQGLFRQPAGAHDNVVNPIMAERVSGRQALVSDVVAADLARGRQLGMPTYSQVLAYLDGQAHDSWDSLRAYVDDDRIAILKEMYASASEVEWLPAVWLERSVAGGAAPGSLAAAVRPLLRTAIATDRHWYERAARPHAFTAGQLSEIRKASLAWLLCAHAESVSESGVTKSPLYLISETNPITSCSKIEKPDFSAWADDSCSA